MALHRRVVAGAWAIGLVAGASRLAPDLLTAVLRSGLPDWLPVAGSPGTTVLAYTYLAMLVDFLAVPVAAFGLGYWAAGRVVLVDGYGRYLCSLAAGGLLGVATGTLGTALLVIGPERGTALALLMAWGGGPLVHLLFAGFAGTAVAELRGLDARRVANGGTGGRRGRKLDLLTLVTAAGVALVCGVAVTAPMLVAALTSRSLSDYVVLTVWSLDDAVSRLKTAGTLLSVLVPPAGAAFLGALTTRRLELAVDWWAFLPSVLLGSLAGFTAGMLVAGGLVPMMTPAAMAPVAFVGSVGPAVRFTVAAFATAAFAEIRRADGGETASGTG